MSLSLCVVCVAMGTSQIHSRCQDPLALFVYLSSLPLFSVSFMSSVSLFSRGLSASIVRLQALFPRCSREICKLLSLCSELLVS